MPILRNKSVNFKELVNAAYDHIVVTDTNGKIIYANPAVSSTTGYSHKEVMGKTPRLWGGLMPTSYYEKLWHTIKELKQPFVGEVTNRRKDGTVYIADVRISPILNHAGKIKYFVGIERDITAVKQLDTSRNEFISLVSHQLRTPLSTLNWYSESLSDGDQGPLNTEQKQYVHEIYDATQRMIKLVNDLLNSTRIDFGEIKFQETEVNLYEVFEDIIRDCQVTIEKSHLKIVNHIKNEKQSIIATDKPSVYIIFENLITNAIKYTPKGGTITLSLKRGTKTVTLDIKDTGYGIIDGDKNKIFNKYFRSEQIKKFSTEGTGLGLFITKSYVTSLGGKISFDSSSNGTTFHVTLPIKLTASKSHE